MKNKLIRCGSYILTAILIIVSVVTLIVSKINHSDPFNKTDDPINVVKQSPVAIDENEFDSTKTYAMPETMSFTAKSLAAAQANGQTVNVKITATITPDDAANQAVDYSIAWGIAPTHGKEAVTDYVTVTQDSDGSLTATISCKKAFDSDKIIVTVTTRDGGYTAKCTVSFVGVANSIVISNSTLNPISDSNRGVYYQLGTNKTYNFDIALDNIFGKVGSKNLTVTLGGSGSLYFGKVYSDASSAMSTFSDMSKKSMADMVNSFIASATISGNTLTLKTGAKVIESYYSSFENDEYGPGGYYYDRYVYEDEFGFTIGNDYEKNAKANTAALPSCYFTVTVKDTVSGISETIKVWIATSVESVSLDKTNVSI